MTGLLSVLGGALLTSWASSNIDPPMWAQLFAFVAITLVIWGAIEMVGGAS